MNIKSLDGKKVMVRAQEGNFWGKLAVAESAAIVVENAENFIAFPLSDIATVQTEANGHPCMPEITLKNLA